VIDLREGVGERVVALLDRLQIVDVQRRPEPLRQLRERNLTAVQDAADAAERLGDGLGPRGAQ
jgi:hypothetical protein